jgi:hypothetical protein
VLALKELVTSLGSSYLHSEQKGGFNLLTNSPDYATLLEKDLLILLNIDLP